MPRTSSKAKSVPGFSKRFNQLLDWAGYEEKARSTVLGELLTKNRTAIHPWLTKDIVPVKLSEVIEAILSECSSYASRDSVEEWLLTADKSRNPMEAMTLQRFNNIDFHLLGKIFTSVYDAAQLQNIDTKKIPSHEMDLIYSTVLKQVARSPKKKIDNTFIADLLASLKKRIKSKKLRQHT